MGGGGGGGGGGDAGGRRGRQGQWWRGATVGVIAGVALGAGVVLVGRRAEVKEIVYDGRCPVRFCFFTRGAAGGGSRRR